MAPELNSVGILSLVSLVMLVVLSGISLLAHIYNLNNIKSKTVGDGQHGTARWARKDEIKKAYLHISYTPKLWREGKNLPDAEKQGIVVGCDSGKFRTTAIVDTGDVHALMIGAAGVGKTAYFLYPNLEYALFAGAHFVASSIASMSASVTFHHSFMTDSPFASFEAPFPSSADAPELMRCMKPFAAFPVTSYPATRFTASGDQ